MSKSYKVVKKTINMGEMKGKTVYTVNPVSYGLLTTEDVAKQISAESTATPGDVLAVLERYAYFVKQNLKNGYDIELLGFGTLFLRFITGKGVAEKEKANASLVKTLVPGFRPSYTLMRNKSRVYNLISDNISLVKYGEEETAAEPGGNTPTEDDNKKPSGEGGTTPAGGGSGSSTGGGDTGKGDNTDFGSGTGSESNPKEFD